MESGPPQTTLRRRRTAAALGAVLAIVAMLMTLAQPAPATTAAPKCTRQAARAAILRTPLGKRFVHFLGPSVWTVGRLICQPLRDGDRIDMVAVAECCTAASPTPLFIFKPGRGSWHLSYATNLTTLIDGLKVRGRTLIETRPVYRRTDPLCCPSSHSHWSVRFNGRRWVVTRIS